METIELLRAFDSDNGCYGVLAHWRVPFCLSVEKPWRSNNRNISCIPEGQYLCHPLEHAKWGKIFHVKEPDGRDVRGRSGVLIHPANTEAELRGCIALGTSFDDVDGVPGVLQSRRALDELITIVGFKVFELYIWSA